MPSPAVLSLSGITKSFVGVHALRGVELDLFAGEVHALMGENGAGKSTLVKVLAGIHQLDSGTITIAGEATTIGSPDASRHAGIAVVHQDPILFPDLTVAENIFIEDLPRTRLGRVRWKALRKQAADLLAELGVAIPVSAPVRSLSAGQQQLIEIARALSFDARILVLDEPTSALSAHEVTHLFGIVESLRSRGVAIIFVGHRLDEVYALADRITVLRDGAWVSTGTAQEMDEERVVRDMVGRTVDVLYPKEVAPIGDVVLEVSDLTSAPAFKDVSFTLREGEILGMAGLVGAGRTEVAHAIFGTRPTQRGTVRLLGHLIEKRSAAEMVRRGLVYVPEDRTTHGGILDWSIAKNMTLANLARLSKSGFVSRRAERTSVIDYAGRLRIKSGGLADALSTLSGGNQQKVVLAKWLQTQPRVLILDDPTRGIDVGTKAEVHRLVSALAVEGLAIILISNDLPEVLAMSDRLLVFNKGSIRARFDAPPFNEELVMRAAISSASSPVATEIDATAEGVNKDYVDQRHP